MIGSTGLLQQLDHSLVTGKGLVRAEIVIGIVKEMALVIGAEVATVIAAVILRTEGEKLSLAFFVLSS